MGEEWRDYALCAETGGDWFADNTKQNKDIVKDALRICGLCSVRDDCLHYALENDERYGIWGGKTERTRQRIRRKLGIPSKHRSPCGTEAGARRHRRAGEPPCLSCKSADAEARQRRKDASYG